MSRPVPGYVGYACSYTPLALVLASGFTPYRVLPVTSGPDQAGLHLHDNLCPHVKRILDRALAGDLPDMAGMIFMNSCDPMRRLADAWTKVKGGNVAMIDLPVNGLSRSVDFFARELGRLAGILESWGGDPVTPKRLASGIAATNEIAEALGELEKLQPCGLGGSVIYEAYTACATSPPAEALAFVKGIVGSRSTSMADSDAPKVFVFGNVLVGSEAINLIEACGARVALEDTCMGSRMFRRMEMAEGEVSFTALARAILSGKACARTFDPARPGGIALDMLEAARGCGARGAICHTAKFCDPYLSRLPHVREVFRMEGMPLLVLEGDCTSRSIGQHSTRIEAFLEMLR